MGIEQEPIAKVDDVIFSTLARVNSLVPDRCRDCAVICELSNSIAELLPRKKIIDSVASQLVGKPGEEFDSLVGRLNSELPIDDMFSVNAILRSARENIANDLDVIDELINERLAEITDIVEGCEGVLRTTAISGDGTVYDISVCSSELSFDEEGQAHVPAHIQRPPDIDTLFDY